jgi:hypothetical protein
MPQLMASTAGSRSARSSKRRPRGTATNEMRGRATWKCAVSQNPAVLDVGEMGDMFFHQFAASAFICIFLPPHKSLQYGQGLTCLPDVCFVGGAGGA